jgi:hypothetical protein
MKTNESTTMNDYGKAVETFKDRLLDEKTQLDMRLTKLTAFLVSVEISKIDTVQSVLLRVQEKVMATYSQCLKERIDLL